MTPGLCYVGFTIFRSCYINNLRIKFHTSKIWRGAPFYKIVWAHFYKFNRKRYYYIFSIYVFVNVGLYTLKQQVWKSSSNGLEVWIFYDIWVNRLQHFYWIAIFLIFRQKPWPWRNNLNASQTWNKHNL